MVYRFMVLYHKPADVYSVYNDIVGASEVKQDCCGDVPAIRSQRGVGMRWIAADGITETEPVGACNLDKVDNIESDPHVPSGLHYL